MQRRPFLAQEPSVGVARALAERLAVDASSLSFSFAVGDPESQLYPGRIIFFPGDPTLWTISFRMPARGQIILYGIEGPEAGRWKAVPLDSLAASKVVVEPEARGLRNLAPPITPQFPPGFHDNVLYPIALLEHAMILAGTAFPIPERLMMEPPSAGACAEMTAAPVGIAVLAGEALDATMILYDVLVIGKGAYELLSRVASQLLQVAVELMPIIDAAQSDLRYFVDAARRVDETVDQFLLWGCYLRKAYYLTLLNDLADATLYAGEAPHYLSSLSEMLEHLREQKARVVSSGAAQAREIDQAIAEGSRLIQNYFKSSENYSALMRNELSKRNAQTSDLVLAHVIVSRLLEDCEKQMEVLERGISAPPKEGIPVLAVAVSPLLEKVRRVPEGYARRISLVMRAVREERKKLPSEMVGQYLARLRMAFAEKGAFYNIFSSLLKAMEEIWRPIPPEVVRMREAEPEPAEHPMEIPSGKVELAVEERCCEVITLDTPVARANVVQILERRKRDASTMEAIAIGDAIRLINTESSRILSQPVLEEFERKVSAICREGTRDPLHALRRVVSELLYSPVATKKVPYYATLSREQAQRFLARDFVQSVAALGILDCPPAIVALAEVIGELSRPAEVTPEGWIKRLRDGHAQLFRSSKDEELKKNAKKVIDAIDRFGNLSLVDRDAQLATRAAGGPAQPVEPTEPLPPTQPPDMIRVVKTEAPPAAEAAPSPAPAAPPAEAAPSPAPAAPEPLTPIPQVPVSVSEGEPVRHTHVLRYELQQTENELENLSRAPEAPPELVRRAREDQAAMAAAIEKYNSALKEEEALRTGEIAHRARELRGTGVRFFRSVGQLRIIVELRKIFERAARAMGTVPALKGVARVLLAPFRFLRWMFRMKRLAFLLAGGSVLYAILLAITPPASPPVDPRQDEVPPPPESRFPWVPLLIVAAGVAGYFAIRYLLQTFKRSPPRRPVPPRRAVPRPAPPPPPLPAAPPLA